MHACMQTHGNQCINKLRREGEHRHQMLLAIFFQADLYCFKVQVRKWLV